MTRPESRSNARRARSAAVAILALWMGACVTPVPLYEGPPRPLEEVAVFAATGPTTVIEIDYKAVPRLETHFALLPGSHHVVFSVHRKMDIAWVDGEWRLQCSAELDMKAGHSYSVQSWVTQRETKFQSTFIIEIVDDVTKETFEPGCVDDERG